MSQSSNLSQSRNRAATADDLESFYHEIGLSAVAAALDLSLAPQPAKDNNVYDLGRIPAFLRQSAAAV